MYSGESDAAEILEKIEGQFIFCTLYSVSNRLQIQLVEYPSPLLDQRHIQLNYTYSFHFHH